MDMQGLLKLIADAKLWNEKATKYTLLVDESNNTHGALFFIEVKNRSYKILIPPPHHEQLFAQGDPTVRQVVQHKEAMLLK